MNHSTKAPTRAEQKRLDMLHELPCLACAKEIETAIEKKQPVPVQPFRTEAHHIVDKGTRKHSGGHAATLPLCSWHHRGECLPGFNERHMTGAFGPSFAKQKKEFVKQYGGERILLVETNAILMSKEHNEARALGVYI